MRKLYTSIHYLLLPLITFALFWKNRANSSYFKRCGELFGCFSAPENCGGIWIHAASVGETNAAIMLIRELQNEFAQLPITVTTKTITSAAIIQHQFGNDVLHLFLPFDVPDANARFLNRIAPRLAIFMETEVWPNKFYALSQRNIPILIANARMSARSQSRFLHVARAIRHILKDVSMVVAQTADDAKRYRLLGVNPQKIFTSGNLKFDLTINPTLFDEADVLKEKIGRERLIWVAASTHAGEEEAVLLTFRELKKSLPNLLLILVPRHPERFDNVFSLCQQHGLSTRKWSDFDHFTHSDDVLVGNVMGKLLHFYAIADVAFVGGSFAPVGGHNIIEPALCRCAIITGPHTQNFRDIIRSFSQAQAIEIVEDRQQLFTRLEFLLQSSENRAALATRAHELVTQHRGALTHHMQLIKKLLVKTNEN